MMTHAVELEIARRQLLCANLNVRIARGLTYLTPEEFRKLAEERNDELNAALDRYTQIRSGEAKHLGVD